jgi:hypothetical protein
MRSLQLLATFLLLAVGNTVAAQEIRYSWIDMSFMGQDIDRAGSLTPLPGQTVDIAVTDGAGVRFRGSIGTWRNFYLMVDYGSTDIDLTGTVTNTDTGFIQEFADEYDVTSIRGGIGLKYTILDATDIYGEITYDSLSFDFGSFAGENFDMDRQDIGASLGVRTLIGRKFMVDVRGRYTDVGDTNLTTGILDPDTLFGIGVAWEVIRGLSIVGDYEAGEINSWSIGFRLDLDED